MRTAFDCCLALWLTVSLGFWGFGFAFGGAPFLPVLNVFTFVVLYAPLLILLAIGIWTLRRREKKIAD